MMNHLSIVLVCMLALGVVSAPADAFAEVVTDVTSTVDVDNSSADEAVQTAECTADGDDAESCIDSCHGENACSGGNGGNGGEACEGGTNVIVIGDGNCEGGDGGDGGNGDGGSDGDDGQDG